MNPALTAAKTRHQKALEKNYPATLRIGGTDYKAAVVLNEGDFMTMDGGTQQKRTATFSVLQSVLPLAAVRDSAVAGRPLKRVTVTHVETSLVYRLRQEWTDQHGVIRQLTCEVDD
jgi:hypothetical protein